MPTTPAGPSTIEADAYKRGMRQLAAAVTVVSTLRAGHPVGLVATAVCSVSVAPPTLLACINRSARSFSAIERSGNFCVNVLEAAQQDAARAFAAADSADRFRHFGWGPLATGAPAITGALVTFDCEVVQAVPAETHMILLGRVVAAQIAPAGKPLMYFAGAYCGLDE